MLKLKSSFELFDFDSTLKFSLCFSNYLDQMQTRRPSAIPPLAIILPHPNIPSRRSSVSLRSAASPHTPRSCGSPTQCSSSLFFASAGNRKSTDSWNSSNQDGEDDQEWEWKIEQTLLLSRVRVFGSPRIFWSTYFLISLVDT